MESSVKDISQKLRAPLPSKLISWRVGRKATGDTMGQALPFVTPRVIQNLLDDIVGPANWKNSFLANTLGTGSASVVAIIELKLDGEWIAKSDAAQVDSFKEGDGTSNNKEMAIKGAYSDAFKRAAVMWGLGRYLYEYEAPWIALDANKRLSEIPILPSHMLPEEERADAEAAQAARDEAAEVVNAAPAADTQAEKPAPKQAEKPTPKQAEKPAEKVAEKPADVPAEKLVQPEAEVTTSAPAETPAAAPVDVQPAVETKAPPAVKVEAPSEEALALERSAAMVDQELGNRTADGKPAATLVKGDASDAATAVPGMPEGLTAEQMKTFKGMVDKIDKKLPTQMLRNYVNGPKAAASLPAEARAYLLVLLDKAEAPQGADTDA